MSVRFQPSSSDVLRRSRSRASFVSEQAGAACCSSSSQPSFSAAIGSVIVIARFRIRVRVRVDRRQDLSSAIRGRRSIGPLQEPRDFGPAYAVIQIHVLVRSQSIFWSADQSQRLSAPSTAIRRSSGASARTIRSMCEPAASGSVRSEIARGNRERHRPARRSDCRSGHPHPLTRWLREARCRHPIPALRRARRGVSHRRSSSRRLTTD